MIKLTLKTDVGKLTAIFIADTISDKVVWTACIEEYPGVVTQADSIQEGMDKLPKILDMVLTAEIQMMMDNL